MKKYEIIVFDFDFTLANSSKGAWQSINYGLKQLGFGEISEEKASETIGLSLEDTLWKLVGAQDNDTTAKFAVFFREKADEVMHELTTFFPKALEIIPKLYKEGYRLGIVSTKFRYRIEKILGREKLASFFDIIIGGEDVKKHKPNPEGLLKVINYFDTCPQSVLYIGDSRTDEKTAVNAKVDFCAMLTGVTPREAFDETNVIKYSCDMIDLLEWLRG
jgi:phosphoglycolate phosphatase